MQHIGAHMLSGPNTKKDHKTERGELLRYFMQKLNMTRARDHLPPLTMPRMGKILQAIPTQDLYFLKSICDDASSRGTIDSFCKKFWWEINPKNHTEEAIAKRNLVESKTKRKYTKKKSQAAQDYDA